jgi:hypothetical protein
MKGRPTRPANSSRARVGLLVVEEIRKLLVVSGGGIVQDRRFELLDTRPSARACEEVCQKPRVGEHLDDDIDCHSEKSSKEDDPDPIVVGAPSRHVDQGQNLEDESPRVEEMAQSPKHVPSIGYPRHQCQRPCSKAEGKK